MATIKAAPCRPPAGRYTNYWTYITSEAVTVWSPVRLPVVIVLRCICSVRAQAILRSTPAQARAMS